MSNIKFCLFSSLIFLSIVGCSKKIDSFKNDRNLIGTWHWVSTDGGMANQIHDTPATSGKNFDLIIRDGNKYLITTNGIITSQGSYSIEYRVCIHDYKNKRVILFSSPSDPELMIESLDNNFLHLSDENYDGLNSTYSRTK